jgi:hypothetical protein
MELRTKCKKIHTTRKNILGNFGDSEVTGLILCINEYALVDT